MSCFRIGAIPFRGLTKNIFSQTAPRRYFKATLTTRSGPQNVSKVPPTNPSDSSKKYAKLFGAKDGFLTIYKFPSIGAVASINHIRRFSTKLLMLSAPITVGLSYAGVISIGSGMIIGLFGTLIVADFYLVGLLCSNVVGYLYVSPDLSTIQVAYVDFEGRRQDDVFPVEDLVPLSEVPSNFLKKYYYRLHRYSKPSHKGLYTLVLSENAITDMDRFNYIFGKIE